VNEPRPPTGESGADAESASDLASSADQLFFQAIEAHFVRLRGAPLLLSPADWRVASSWRQRGIPLAVVHGALEEVFARRRERGTESRVNSLRYCAQAVEKAWRDQVELGRVAAPAGGPGGEVRSPPTLAESLDLLAGRLPETLPEIDTWRRRIRALEGNPARVEEGLAALDAELLAALATALPVEERTELRDASRAATARLAERLGPRQVEGAVERLFAVRVRERWRVPILSLFSPEARRPTRSAPAGAAADAEPSAGHRSGGGSDDDRV
jgi:hypothetical protein